MLFVAGIGLGDHRSCEGHWERIERRILDLEIWEPQICGLLTRTHWRRANRSRRKTKIGRNKQSAKSALKHGVKTFTGRHATSIEA
jgi:hypothetical protein